MSGCRSEADRLFQILGPATSKLLLLSRVFVLGIVRTLAWAERSWGCLGDGDCSALTPDIVWIGNFQSMLRPPWTVGSVGGAFTQTCSNAPEVMPHR